MGALCSASREKVTIESAMPKYCKADPVISEGVLKLAHRTWHLVVDEVDGDELESHLASSKVVTFYDAFYQHLFEIAPGTKPLFRNSLKSQGRALVKMINAAVTLLGKGDVDSLTTALKELAARHVAYGVHPFHYTPVGLCILHAFSRTIAEEEWTTEAQDAWVTVYSLICQVMVPVAVEGWWTTAKVAEGQVAGETSGHTEFRARKGTGTTGSAATVTTGAMTDAEPDATGGEPAHETVETPPEAASGGAPGMAARTSARGEAGPGTDAQPAPDA